MREFPSISNYNIAVENQYYREQNNKFKPEFRNSGELHFEPGGRAVVYKVSDNSNVVKAIKLFTGNRDNLFDRYSNISDYLLGLESDYFVDFNFKDELIFCPNVNPDNTDNIFPGLVMDWAEGKTLGGVVQEFARNKDKAKLSELAQKFKELAQFIIDNDFAHGDLKHDNIIVDKDLNLKLIDYDDMYIPTFSGQKSAELGTPSFQHPKRTPNDFNKNIDDFSILTIYTSLLALSKYPELYEVFEDQQNLLFRHEDFLDSENSELFHKLDKDLELARFSSMVKKSLRCDHIYILNLNEVLDGKFYGVQLRANHNTRKNISTLPVDKLINRLENLKNFILLEDFDNSLKAAEKLKEFNFEDAVEKVIYDIQNRKMVLNILESNSDLFIDLVSRYYALSEKTIIKYDDKWQWELLSANKSLQWSHSLIDKYLDKWAWGEWSMEDRCMGLSKNESLPWSYEFIERYKDKWCWRELSQNQSLPWSEFLIEKYECEWDWDYLSKNRSLSWSEIQLEKFKWNEYRLKWNWEYLCENESLPWSENFIKKYKGYNLIWPSLSMNKAIPWSEYLIEKYKDKFNYSYDYWKDGSGWSEGHIVKLKGWTGLSRNTSIIWTEILIEKFVDNWDWWELSQNMSLPWSDELIEKYKDKWYWRILSRNESLPWTEDLIEKYRGKWDWHNLSRNKSLPWSEELIEKYKERWHWQLLSKSASLDYCSEDFIEEYFIKSYKSKFDWLWISENESLPLSVSFFEKYQDKWDWGDGYYNDYRDEYYENGGISAINSTTWTESFIEKFQNKLDWGYLSENESLPWSVKLISRFAERFRESKPVWETLKPYIDDEIIEKVFERLDNK